jgi:hypothetical protein
MYHFCGGWGLLAPAQSPSRRATTCLLSATAHPVYSQLCSISGDRLVCPQLEDVLCCGNGDPVNIGVQDVRWENNGTEQAEDYTFLYGEENEDHQ